ncbi:DUF1059 domain-containing protein [Spirosoma soli]|uniref:DUF1059 domain-containing protein n=1 Tax=Spirosoma soli TaxID=1770529 RepID=A0ABW5MAU9_9BACT
MKTLNCCDIGFVCAGIIRAESESEVLELAAQHAHQVHQVDVTAEMAEQIRRLIKEETAI